MNNITRHKAAKLAAEFFGSDTYRSTAARSDSGKCELVSPILHYEDIETLQNLLRVLRKAGAMSSPSRDCGVHIHVGLKSDAGHHTAQTLTTLANIMAAHEGRTARYCRTVEPRFIENLKNAKPSTMNELADIWYNANNADYSRNAHYNPSRYHMLNLHACFASR